MTKFTWACLFALPLLALAPRAQAGCCCFCPPPINVNCHHSFSLQGTIGCAPFNYGGAQAGPWYSYFPYEAHFQTPAPYGYPFWPTSVPTMAYPGTGAAYPNQVPAMQPETVQPTSYQPVGYQATGYPSAVPAYWYAK